MATTFTEYREGLATTTAFRKEAEARVAEWLKTQMDEYLSTNKSDEDTLDLPLDIHINQSSTGGGHFVRFAEEIGVKADGKVLVFLESWSAFGESYDIRVPLSVVEGTIV